MEFVSVLAAAITIWIIGAIWYGVASKPWMAASGVTAEQANAMNKLIYLASFVVFIFLAGFMRYVWARMGVASISEGLVMGACVGAFFGLPWMAVNNMYTGRPVMLTIIDGAYAVMGLAAGGAVLVLL